MPYNGGMGFPDRGGAGSTRPGDLRSFKTGRLKRLCLTSRASGMEACTCLRGKYRERMVHITLVVLEILGAVGAVASIVSLVLYLHDRKKK